MYPRGSQSGVEPQNLERALGKLNSCIFSSYDSLSDWNERSKSYLTNLCFFPFVFQIITFCNPHEHQVVCHYRNYNLRNMFLICFQEISIVIPSKIRLGKFLSWTKKFSRKVWNLTEISRRIGGGFQPKKPDMGVIINN